MAAPGYLGVTPPISVAQPSEREREITVSLMNELRNQNSFESDEESRRRELVLGRVAGLVKKFVRDVSIAKGLSEVAANAAGGKIFTFGSYRLGVHSPGTDIDICCVVPRHGATEVAGVPDAFVPMIGAKISGISMDLLCAPLNMSAIPDDLSLKDNNILKNLDESVVRSVNGTRLTDELLRLVPNVQVFRDALRCIKLWAQRKAVYSNKIGYLGGVAWAMLVARVCQLYPNAVAGAIVSRFFTVMSKWQWPQPVLLKQIEEGPLQLYQSDRAHRMPIITPNYPSMCATHNVSETTHAVMCEAIVQGADGNIEYEYADGRPSTGAQLLEKIVAGTAQWSELFTKHEFFHRYKNYVQVVALARERGESIKWTGTVESKMRHFVLKLEYLDALNRPSDSIVPGTGSKSLGPPGPHPFAKGFARVVRCKDAEEAGKLLRGEGDLVVGEEDKDDDAEVEGKGEKVFMTSFFVGLGIKPRAQGETAARRLDMSFAISEFTKMVKGEAFDEANKGIVVRHVKSAALPPYVYDPGELEAKTKTKVTGKRGRRGVDSGYTGISASPRPSPSRSRPNGEREITVSLMNELRNQNSFESRQESRRRELVLGRVAGLVKKFVRDVSIAKGLSEVAANAAGGKIFTFGSYRLGVHSPGTDIDICCVVPRHVTREDFFAVFEPMVRATEGATEVAGVPDAFVPMIGAKISGISMDLLCAPLNMSAIPDDLSLKDNNILKNLDESVVRSVNGTRLTDELLRLVPNVQVFRDALRCIKLWAQRKAVYSNKIGYLGGVAWAMLVARVCQLYPNAVAGAIVSRFFTVMSKWQWPQPVLLKQIEEGPLQLYQSDRAHRMPIITPNYPSMCATHNVSETTHAVMCEAIVQGADGNIEYEYADGRPSTGAQLLEKIVAGTAQWSELFTKHEFFHRYKNYVQVVALARERGESIKWTGTVESKMRHFVLKLEYLDALNRPSDSIVPGTGSKSLGPPGPHPFAKGFARVVRCKDAEEAGKLLRGEGDLVVGEEDKDDDAEVEGKGEKVFMTSFFVGLGIKPRAQGETAARRLDMSFAISEFTKMVKGEAFDEANKGIVVRHVKSAALPPYVYDPGELEAKTKTKVTGKRGRRSMGATEEGPNKRPRLAMP
ncbi:hypothetical protein MKEN_00725300 [Mycena kentingensis (nom. inval.)]|nr:hypothetical protein MKEN_00725300 [Mycena kentingensis (nom. inval.)]